MEIKTSVPVDVFSSILKKKMAQYPDLRIGQLLSNCIPPGKDLFSLSTVELCQAIQNYNPLNPNK